MPTNLTLSCGLSTGRFYTPIHSTIAAEATLPPSVREFADWLDRSRPTGRVLDAGCGVHGLNSRQCRMRFLAVEAIDFNPDAVRANADIGAAQASVLELPFEDGRFDLTLCTGVAHHTPDPARAIAELSRVTKPGGTVYLSLYTFRRSPAAFVVRLWRLFGRVVPFSWMHRLFGGIPAINNFVLDHMYVPVLWLFAADEVRQLCADVGLTVEQEFRSSMDPFPTVLTGDGLLRVFVCRRS